MNISDKSFQSCSATTVEWDHVAASWRGACSPQTPHICLSLGLKLAQGNCRDLCGTSLVLHAHVCLLTLCIWRTIKLRIRMRHARLWKSCVFLQEQPGKTAVRDGCAAFMWTSRRQFTCFPKQSSEKQGAREGKGNVPLNQPSRRTNWTSSTSSNSGVAAWSTEERASSVYPTGGLQNCAGRSQSQRGGQQCFPSLFRMSFYGLCSASQHTVVSAAAGSLNSAEVGANLSPEAAPRVPGRQNFTQISGGTLLNSKGAGWEFLCFKESLFFVNYCLQSACC